MLSKATLILGHMARGPRISERPSSKAALAIESIDLPCHIGRAMMVGAATISGNLKIFAPSLRP